MDSGSASAPDTQQITACQFCCTTCGKEASPGDPLRHCTRCSYARYCGKDCQKSDWDKHRQICDKLAYSIKHENDLGEIDASESITYTVPTP